MLAPNSMASKKPEIGFMMGYRVNEAPKLRFRSQAFKGFQSDPLRLCENAECARRRCFAHRRVTYRLASHHGPFRSDSGFRFLLDDLFALDAGLALSQTEEKAR